MKRNEGNITDDLLVRYLLGEVSETEKHDVEAWVNANDENKRHLDQFRTIWVQSSSLASESSTDADEAWARFKQRTQQVNYTIKPTTLPLRTTPSYNWLKIAAVLILLLGGAYVAWLATDNNTSTVSQPIVKATLQAAPENETMATTLPDTPVNQVTETPVQLESKALAVNEVKAKHPAKIREKHIGQAGKLTTQGELICNSTPCSIEICIVQRVNCQNNKNSTISSCSTLEPDKEGRLHYKAFDKLGSQCASSVEEITIKWVSTGETIVLNSESKPATAQDFFCYLTGQTKGAIVAGTFHADCNALDQDHGLRFDNNFGELHLQ